MMTRFLITFDKSVVFLAQQFSHPVCKFHGKFHCFPPALLFMLFLLRSLLLRKIRKLIRFLSHNNLIESYTFYPICDQRC